MASLASRALRSPLLQGLAVSSAAARALDGLSTFLYEHESRSTRRAEDRARGHRPVYEVAVDDLAHALGTRLSRRQRRAWGWRFHQVSGVAAALGYLALRKRNPRVGWGYGLAFGTAFFLLVDELLMPALGWSPGPRAFSWRVHARGAVAHLGFGIAAETTARALSWAAALAA